MIDCFMPIDRAVAAVDPRRGRVISHDTVRVGNIRSVDREVPVSFLERFGHQSVVLGTQASTLNHRAARARGDDGGGANGGLTLCETVAAAYGRDMPRPRLVGELGAQAADAHRLLQSGDSCAITLDDGGLAFDRSHDDHASTQAENWDRVLEVAAGLITRLEQTALLHPDGEPDGSIWDRTLMVFSTEFGRDKWDRGGRFGTGHHLNNGLLLVSPLLAGDQSLGEPDPNNGIICGFDVDTGQPTPMSELGPGEDPVATDPRLPPCEARVYGGICDVLGIAFHGQETLPVLKG